jgi:hypothetical protein
MAIFNGAPPAYQSTQAANTPVGTAAAGVQIYNAGSATVVSTSGTAYYTFPTAAVLSNLTFVNTGTATAYVGSTGTPTTASLAVPPGFQVTIQGTAVVSATSSNFNLWAVTAAGTTNFEASLATVVAVD